MIDSSPGAQRKQGFCEIQESIKPTTGYDFESERAKSFGGDHGPNSSFQRNPARGSSVFRQRRGPGPLNSDVRQQNPLSFNYQILLSSSRSSQQQWNQNLLTSYATDLIAEKDLSSCIFGDINLHPMDQSQKAA